ncbi:hypothetical protein QYE76_070540 [Lolium multiflorum]|uniref:Reverse transcriptase domain-containing protein n=1 Tax=Lolium multiflorum TaxID=4521 RepID=A0AAD8SI49_LOLMU|nr:hypothetical protein QYE76_070540 [Lolium multiflorum]
MTRRAADPTWSPWRSNAEVRERGEDEAARARSRGQRAWQRSLAADPAPHKPTRNTETCPAQPIWIRLREVHPHQQQRKWVNDLKNESGGIQAGSTAHAAKEARARIRTRRRTFEAMDEDDNSPDPKAGSAGKSNPFEKKSVGAYHTFLGTPTIRATKCHLPTYDAAVLKDQIGRNVHAYVDDIAVMTRKGSDLISDLTETFENLRRYKMMLNPLKCVFGVPAGKLLGFIVSHRH